MTLKFNPLLMLDFFSKKGFHLGTKSQAHKTRLEKNTRIECKDIENSGVYLIEEGYIKIERVSSTGKHTIIGALGRGEILGLRAIYHQQCSCSAVAKSDVLAWRIPKDVFCELVESNKELNHFVIECLAREANQALEWSAIHSLLSASERINRVVETLNKKFPSTKWSRAEIASWAGTTTETTIRTLSQSSKRMEPASHVRKPQQSL